MEDNIYVEALQRCVIGHIKNRNVIVVIYNHGQHVTQFEPLMKEISTKFLSTRVVDSITELAGINMQIELAFNKILWTAPYLIESKLDVPISMTNNRIICVDQDGQLVDAGYLKTLIAFELLVK